MYRHIQLAGILNGILNHTSWGTVSTRIILGALMAIISHAPPRLSGYDFVRTLGTGTTATVYLYRLHTSAHPVAVKVSNQTLDCGIAAQFHRENAAMVRLSEHSYILTLYHADVTADGHGYMILEYAPGGTYEPLMKSRSLTCAQVLDLGIKLAGALGTAHRSNIIHHDIKPSNILITGQGLPALSDFGISTDAYDHTETGCSPPWAPPEVLLHMGNGAERADIYSLGATLYALLVGCSPYQHEYHPHTQSELIRLILNQPLPRINRADVPMNIEQILRKSLAKDPDLRYYSALEFARAMQHAQHAFFGRITPLTVDGVPPYPKEVAHLRRPREPDLHNERTQRRWVKPTIIAAGVATTAVTVCLVFVCAVLPRMDSITGSTTIQVSLAYSSCNGAAHNGKDSRENHGHVITIAY